jgi:TPP-dependent pyruvate/acetoin dehydrogenase alpha subunit
LLASGVTESTVTALENEVAEEVAEAATWAEAQPDAQPEDVLLHTWAEFSVAAPTWA